VFADAAEAVEGGPGAQTDRAHVVGERLLAVERFERCFARVGVDTCDAGLPDLAVQHVGQRDADVVFEAGSTDDPVDFVLNDVVGRLVDDDQLGVGGEGPFERSGEGQTGVTGTENGDLHGWTLGPDGHNLVPLAPDPNASVAGGQNSASEASSTSVGPPTSQIRVSTPQSATAPSTRSTYASVVLT